MVPNLSGAARPSHDTFGDVPVWTQRSSRVASCLDPSHPELLVVAIDGKTARRSYDRAGSKRAMQRLGHAEHPDQVRTEEKSNEITAIPQLLDLLDLTAAS